MDRRGKQLKRVGSVRCPHAMCLRRLGGVAGCTSFSLSDITSSFVPVYNHRVLYYKGGPFARCVRRVYLVLSMFMHSLNFVSTILLLVPYLNTHS